MTTPAESPAYLTIRDGIALREQGRSPEAKALMEPLVAEVDGGDDAFAKVFLAHSLADVQEDPEDELAWDLRALACMDELTDQLAIDRGNHGGKNALLPSLQAPSLRESDERRCCQTTAYGSSDSRPARQERIAAG